MRPKLPVLALIVIALIGVMAFAAPQIGRFSPTHAIVQPVYCVACHPEEFDELNSTTHIDNFARETSRHAALSAAPDEIPYDISVGCTMCHNNWDNRRSFGLGDFYVKKGANDIYITKNAQILPWMYGIADSNKTFDNSEETDNISIKLINETGPGINASVTVYRENWATDGLATSIEFVVNEPTLTDVTFNTANTTYNQSPAWTAITGDYFKVVITNNGANNLSAEIGSLYGVTRYNKSIKDIYVVKAVEPTKTADTDVLVSVGQSKLRVEYALHTTWLYNATRMDAVWGDWSAISPSPMQYASTFGRARPDRSADADGYDRVVSCDSAANGMCHITLATAGLSMEKMEWKKEVPGTTYTVDGKNPNLGTTTFYGHDMKLTTTEYAAKPVKLCGVCHIDKMPPMLDDGTPIGTTIHSQISKEYNQNGTSNVGGEDYHAPTSWAHQQVACIRCHSHAGIGAGITE